MTLDTIQENRLECSDLSPSRVPSGAQRESDAAIEIQKIIRGKLCRNNPKTQTPKLSLESRGVEIINSPLPSPVLLINGLQGIKASEEDEAKKTAKEGIDEGFSNLQSMLGLDNTVPIVPITYSVTNHTLTIHNPDGDKPFDLNMESSLRRLLEENGSSRSDIDSLHEELNTLNETLKKHIETARPDVIVSSPGRVKNSSWSPNGMSMLLSNQPELRGLFKREKQKQSFLSPLKNMLGKKDRKIVEQDLKKLKKTQDDAISEQNAEIVRLNQEKSAQETGEDRKIECDKEIEACRNIIEQIKSSDLDLQWHTVLMKVTIPDCNGKTGKEIMEGGKPAEIEKLLNFSFDQMVVSTEAKICSKIFGPRGNKGILQKEHLDGLRRAAALAVYIEKKDGECGTSHITTSGTRPAPVPNTKELYLKAEKSFSVVSRSEGQQVKKRKVEDSGESGHQEGILAEFGGAMLSSLGTTLICGG